MAIIVVCDTAKVRFFKQITTNHISDYNNPQLFAILQKYDFSSKSQPTPIYGYSIPVVCDTAKVRFFKQITTISSELRLPNQLFAILQKYDFSSKSQQKMLQLRYRNVVCDTAKVRFFKQITTARVFFLLRHRLFAILQKYDFSSKSQQVPLRLFVLLVVCDTAKVRFFKQITTARYVRCLSFCCLRYCKSTIFQANHNHIAKA